MGSVVADSSNTECLDCTDVARGDGVALEEAVPVSNGDASSFAEP